MSEPSNLASASPLPDGRVLLARGYNTGATGGRVLARRAEVDQLPGPLSAWTDVPDNARTSPVPTALRAGQRWWAGVVRLGQRRLAGRWRSQ
jgi:hypothetical protein